MVIRGDRFDRFEILSGRCAGSSLLSIRRWGIGVRGWGDRVGSAAADWMSTSTESDWADGQTKPLQSPLSPSLGEHQHNPRESTRTLRRTQPAYCLRRETLFFPKFLFVLLSSFFYFRSSALRY